MNEQEARETFQDEYKIYIAFTIKHVDKSSAIMRVKEILELAEAGHELYELSDNWTIVPFLGNH